MEEIRHHLVNKLPINWCRIFSQRVLHLFCWGPWTPNKFQMNISVGLVGPSYSGFSMMRPNRNIPWALFSLGLPCNSGAKDRCPEWPTPPKFNSSPLKNDGWEMILSSWGPAYFQGRTVSFREGSIFGFSSSRNELIFYPLESSILTRPKIFRQQSLGVGMEIPYR